MNSDAMSIWGLRLRIEAAIKEKGPLTTAEILHRFRESYSEQAIRTALRFLDDDRKVERPSQKQRWRLVGKKAQ